MHATLEKLGFILIVLPLAFVSKAQPAGCIFQSPQVAIRFGTGDTPDPNSGGLWNYRRVQGSCPVDGHYSLASHTSGCFSDDWHTLTEDHTAGDVDGNMLLVNGAPYPGTFLSTPVAGLKSNTVYEICLWALNLCRPTNKCPFPLLPNLNIRLETPDGKVVTSVVTGSLPRVEEPRWSAYRAYFTTPASMSTLLLVMSDNSPGGCGNDFALDDITFRECVKQTADARPALKSKAAAKQSTTAKPLPKKITGPGQQKIQPAEVITPKPDTTSNTILDPKKGQKIIPSIPLVLKTRENALAREIETEAGQIKIDVYDNGVIDGDTVSIYHNNTLIKSHMGLSQKPISITIAVNPSEPHHEITMVADNLGSIPPNTSVMIITTTSGRYEVFISSSMQKNARVVLDLKK